MPRVRRKPKKKRWIIHDAVAAKTVLGPLRDWSVLPLKGNMVSLDDLLAPRSSRIPAGLHYNIGDGDSVLGNADELIPLNDGSPAASLMLHLPAAAAVEVIPAHELSQLMNCLYGLGTALSKPEVEAILDPIMYNRWMAEWRSLEATIYSLYPSMFARGFMSVDTHEGIVKTGIDFLHSWLHTDISDLRGFVTMVDAIGLIEHARVAGNAWAGCLYPLGVAVSEEEFISAAVGLCLDGGSDVWLDAVVAMPFTSIAAEPYSSGSQEPLLQAAADTRRVDVCSSVLYYVAECGRALCSLVKALYAMAVSWTKPEALDILEPSVRERLLAEFGIIEPAMAILSGLNACIDSGMDETGARNAGRQLYAWLSKDASGIRGFVNVVAATSLCDHSNAVKKAMFNCLHPACISSGANA